MWRQAVNRALRRLTGFQLERPGTRAGRQREDEERVARLKARLDRSNRRLARTRRRLETTTARLHRTASRLEAARERASAADQQLRDVKRRRRAIPSHYDEAAARFIRQVRQRTMTDHAKLYGLVEATRYVARQNIPGAIVECGVWRGGSMQAVALALQEEGVIDRPLHLYDTFEGMPPPTDRDHRKNVSAAELLATHEKGHRVWAVAGLDDVQEAMREVGYPTEMIHFHQGLVEETIPADAPEQIALLRLDTDWYDSTKHELEHLYDRIVPGGVLILDDYGDWEGARDAADEFISARKEPLLLLPLGTGRLAVKPLR